MKLIKCLLLLTLCPLAVQAQDEKKDNEFSMSVQIRPRAEYRNGALTPRYEGVEPTGFITNRARLSMDYKRSNLDVKLSAQHVGTWGQDPQIDKNGRFILNEAWAQLHFGEGFFAKLGRQSLIYDDERILGGLDWNVAGRYHDALKLGYADESNKVDLVLAFNQNDDSRTSGGTYYDSSTGQPYKSMQTLWYHYGKSSSPFGFSVLLMNLGWETGSSDLNKSETKYMQTVGTDITYKPTDWNIHGAFYYQMGKNKSDVKTSALMASAKVGYTIDQQWGVNVGYDYLSGEDGQSSTYNAFDPLYGTHHKFYGAMDYFYASSFVSGVAPGLQDIQAGATFKASKKVNMSLNYHYFLIAVEVNELDKGLGHEIDYQIDWSIMKDVKLSAGYSFMRGTETMDAVKGGSHKSWQDWAWVSLNINPKVLFTKW